MCFRILGIILFFKFSFLTSQAQWKFHQASVFGGDTVYQPIFSLKNANEGFCVAGRNAMAEGKNRKNALYVTTNGGLNWTRILDGENTVMGLGSLGEDTIIVSLGGHLMRSFDGMQTWDTVWTEGGFINAFKDDNLFYYVIPGKGTFKSNDLGVSLTKVSDKGWYWVNPRIGYTLNSTPMEILKTQDSGKTWVKCSSPDPGLTPLNGVFSFPSEKVIYAKVRDKMYRSDDAGDSWKVLQPLVGQLTSIPKESILLMQVIKATLRFRDFCKDSESMPNTLDRPPTGAENGFGHNQGRYI